MFVAKGSNGGIIIMMLAAAMFGISDIGVKVLGDNLSAWQITGGRGLLGLIGVLAVVRFRPRALMTRQWPVQLGLGLAGTLGFTCFVMSIKYLPLSMAMPLAYTFPAFGALLSPLINQEKPTGHDWAAVVLALAAVICLSRGQPSAGETLSPAGFAFGLVGAFFVALMTNLARRQTQAVKLSVNLFYLYLANAAVCLPLALMLDRPPVPPPADLAGLLLVIAPGSVLGFCFMFIGYRRLSAVRGGTILMLEVAVAGSYGLIVLGEPLTPFIAAGGLLMVLSALMITRSSRRAAPETTGRPRPA